MSKSKGALFNVAVISAIVGGKYSYNDLEKDNGGAFYNSKGKRTKPQKKSKNRGKR